MGNNAQQNLPNVFSGLILTVFNVGAANKIEATGSFGTWYFDAGLPHKKTAKLSGPVDVFFLTHWHTDHYSIFLDSSNTFYNFVGPRINLSSTKSLINFASKLKAMSLPQNHCFFTDLALAGFMKSHKGVSIQRTSGQSTDPNDDGLIYILDVTGLEVSGSFSKGSLKASGPFFYRATPQKMR